MRNSAILAAGCAALCFLPSTTYAQDNADKDLQATGIDSAQDSTAAAPGKEDALGMNEIVVTASARRVNMLNSSISVSALSQEAIADAAPRTTAEIFRQIPGIRSESSGGDGNANIAVRGLPVASGGAKFLQLQEDGMPVMQFGDIAFGNSDIFLRADQTIATIQAVRGGSASTMASNAPGGVINFVSKDGRKAGGTILGTVGLDYRSFRLDFDYGGALGANTYFNLGGFWRRGEGPRDAGYDANSGYQIKANITHDFESGHIRLYAKHLDDRAIGYLPMPSLVTGTNRNPHFGSLPGFDIRSDTVHSAYFTRDIGLDGNNNRYTTDIREGMHPVVTSLGAEAVFDVADGLKLEERFRWSSVHGRFVSPFPAEVGDGQAIANSVGAALTGVNGTYGAVYANGPQAGQALAPGALLMRTHLFNVDLKDLGSFTNDIKLTKTFGPGSITAGFYKARQTIKMDWVWNSYLMEVKGHNAALVDVTDSAGTVLTRDGLYAYGVPFWGNCCTRRYDLTYDIDAPYLAGSFEVGGLSIDASVRHDHMRARGSYAGSMQDSFDVNGDGVIQPVEQSVSLMDNGAASPVRYSIGYWSWSVGANYRFDNRFSAFARISRGGRANADRLMFGVVQPDGSVRRQDAVDFVDQVEAGVKYGSGPLGLFLTVFHARTQEQNYEATTQRFLDRSYKATGVEFEGALRKGIFDLRASATYTHARISKDAITPDNAGHIPRRQASFIYQVTPSIEIDRVRAGFNVVGTTKAYAQDNNDLVFPAYAQVNAFVNLRIIDNMQLSVNANNLFNVVGVTEAEEGSIVDNAQNIVRARTINGRTVSASLRFDF